MEENHLKSMEEIFKMFGNIGRLKIIMNLKNREQTVTELTDTCGLKPSATSQQLKDMKAARLIKSQKRGLNVYYSLCDQHIIEILDSAMAHICGHYCK